RHTRSYRDWSSDVCSSDLGPLLETGRLDDKRLAFPLPDRVAVPCGIGIVGQRTAIGENLPVGVELLVENRDLIRRLDQLERDARLEERRVGIGSCVG